MDSHGSFFGTPLPDSPWKLCLSEIRALSPPLKINIVGGVTQIVFTQITWSEKPCWSDLGGKEVPRGRTFLHRFLEATRSSGGCKRCRLAPVPLHILFRNQGLLRFYRHIREIRKAIISPVCFENEHIMEFFHRFVTLAAIRIAGKPTKTRLVWVFGVRFDFLVTGVGHLGNVALCGKNDMLVCLIWWW